MAPVGLESDIRQTPVADRGAVRHINSENLVGIADDDIGEQNVSKSAWVSVPILMVAEEEVRMQLLSTMF